MRLAAYVRGLALPLLGLVVLAAPALAGGGPETTLVVVNTESPGSLEVANAYARLRDLPASHVLYLEGVPSEPVVSVDAFRDRILKPIEAYLEAQGLKDDVDTIAYSTGFPYGVNVEAEKKAKEFKPKPRQAVTATASLTGLTFFYRSVLARDPARYLDLNGNGYFRRPSELASGDQRERGREELRLFTDMQGAFRSKDYRRAAEALRKLVQIAPEEASYWYDLACCLALLEKPDDAMDALERAVAAGFANADHAAGDADLESLRDRPGFQELLDAMRAQGGSGGVQGTRGFSAKAAWTGADEPDENPAPDAPGRYRLAVMLGWTGRYGNSVREVLRCLEQAAASDGSQPQGTVYMLVNQDRARSLPRRGFFRGTIQALERLGRKGEILEAGKDGQDGKLPRGKDDVLGVVAGIASFRWGKDDADLLPGALAEHLTSFGAHFGTSGQTKCTEFIRHGAAGTCGTVAEPTNQWFKFPVPYMHVHYAQGCSMAESFYQSIFGPYQQLILGDPLARPFARFGDIRFASPDPSTPWSGTAEIHAEASAPPGHAIRAVELWVDGRKVAEAEPGAPLRWDTTKGADGVHDVRLVAVDTDPVRTRWYTKAIVHVANGAGSVEVRPPDQPVAYGEPLKLKGRANGIESLEAVRGTTVIASTPVKGTSWRLEVPTALLGEGRTIVRLRGVRADGGHVLVPEVPVEVTPPARILTPAVLDESLILPGLRATMTDGDGGRHEGVLITLNDGPGRRVSHDLKDLGIEKPVKVELSGFLRAPETGVWELEVHTRSALAVTIGDEEVLSLAEAPPSGRAYVRIGLAEGWHAFSLTAEGPGAGRLGALLGGPRAQVPLEIRSLGWVPEDWAKPTPWEALLEVSGGDPRPAFDGDRGGRGVPATEEGLGVHWKKTERYLVGVVLWPFRNRNVPPAPKAWGVQTRSSQRARWKDAKDARLIACPGPEDPRSGKNKIVVGPLYFVIEFAKTSARGLRVVPGTSEDGRTTSLNEVEIRVRSRRRR